MVDTVHAPPPLGSVLELLTRRVTRLVPHLVIEVDAKAEEGGPSDVTCRDGLGKQEVGQGQGAELPQTGVEHGLINAHEEGGREGGRVIECVSECMCVDTKSPRGLQPT